MLRLGRTNADQRERLLAALAIAPAILRRKQTEGSYIAPSGIDEARASFRSFLTRWQFYIREGRGKRLLGAELWPSQAQITDLVETGVLRFLDLKGGKLGCTEVWIAFGAWRGIFAPPGSRVHLFSQTGDDAKTLLDLLRVGIWGLPHDWGIRTAPEERYGDTTRSLKVRGADGEIRSFWSYAPRGTASISESAIHLHIDELAHMQRGKDLYNSVITTVPDDGTVVVLSRGHGVDNHMATLWEQIGGDDLSMDAYLQAHAAALARSAVERTTMVPLFQPYTMRPGRDEAWRAQQAATMTSAGLRWYAPETPEDAMAGDADEEFVPVEMWDQLEQIDPLPDGDRTPLVIGLDAGVRDDYTAMVGVTRHPERHDEVAVRFVREWRPSPVVDFADVRAAWRDYKARYNVVCTAYDKYALEEMAQDLGKEGYWESFDQGSRRLLADKGLKDAISQRRIARPRDGTDGQAILRRAVLAAGAKTGQEEDKLRIVKRAMGKIDPLVALSMSRDASLSLNI